MKERNSHLFIEINLYNVMQYQIMSFLEKLLQRYNKTAPGFKKMLMLEKNFSRVVLSDS